MGLTCNLEVKKRENGVNITVISDNNSILIGKNGRTLNALNQLLKQVLFKNKILYNSNGCKMSNRRWIYECNRQIIFYQ